MKSQKTDSNGIIFTLHKNFDKIQLITLKPDVLIVLLTSEEHASRLVRALKFAQEAFCLEGAGHVDYTYSWTKAELKEVAVRGNLRIPLRILRDLEYINDATMNEISSVAYKQLKRDTRANNDTFWPRLFTKASQSSSEDCYKVDYK